MKTKAIIAHCGLPFWVDVAQYLNKQHKWDICYLIGHKRVEDKVRQIFPGAIFHPNHLANRNQYPESCNHIPFAHLDEELITALSPNESIFMKMMDRHDYDGSFTYRKRLFYYHFQLMYWKGVLDYYLPDIVVFRTAPHMGYDYILYALCMKMRIRTVMFERSTLPGIIYPVASFEHGSHAIRQAYKISLEKSAQKRDINLSKSSQKHIQKLSSTYQQAMPFHTKYKLKTFKGGKLDSTPAILFKICINTVKGLILSKRDPYYLQKSIYKHIGVFKKKRLFKHYNDLSRQVDLSKSYIFVALQCEPERQTCPNGGVFGNQHLMIDFLSKNIPDNWLIYVKEHPSQFKSYQIAERSRTKKFYDQINALPNVHLVDLDVNSFELIDHAIASASVSGTVGWESIVRSKPMMLFGYSWYSACDGVFITHTVGQLRNAIKTIQNGYRVDPMKVKLFVSVLETEGINGYIDRIYQKMNLIPSETNIQNLAECIHLFYSSAIDDEPVLKQ